MKRYAAPALITGMVFLMAVSGSVRAPASTPAAADGGALFAQNCKACHSLTPGQNSPMGPNLAGITGQKAASGAYRYSPALKASGIVWTREKLDAYLAGPAKLVPGTRMFPSMGDAAKRAAIIDYLATPGG